MNYQISDEVLQNISISEEKQAAFVSEEETTILVKAVAEKLKCSEDAAMVGVCIICQKGGTAKKAQNNIYTIVEGRRLELGMIRESMNQKKMNITLRQFARTHATTIQRICKHYGIFGDLAKKLSREHENLSREDLYWASNFQMDNGDCPAEVRNILMEHYYSLFKTNNTKYK